MADLTYTDDGLFLTLIPHTDAGEAAWGQIFEASGGKPPATWLPGIKAQLRAAGITIRKGHPKVKIDYTDEELLTALGA